MLKFPDLNVGVGKLSIFINLANQVGLYQKYDLKSDGKKCQVKQHQL